MTCCALAHSCGSELQLELAPLSDSIQPSQRLMAHMAPSSLMPRLQKFRNPIAKQLPEEHAPCEVRRHLKEDGEAVFLIQVQQCTSNVLYRASGLDLLLAHRWMLRFSQRNFDWAGTALSTHGLRLLRRVMSFSAQLPSGIKNSQLFGSRPATILSKSFQPAFSMARSFLHFIGSPLSCEFTGKILWWLSP